jgi:uncharacterized protein (TIGR00299 family) protein
MAVHLHLDLVGGLSGDMFISGMLDTYPELKGDLQQVIVAAGFPDLVKLTTRDHDDGTLTGTQFDVSATESEGHHHRHYSEIKRVLTESSLSTSTKSAALEMFRLIAEVEAAIHGKKVEEVAFHEVGAWDSIADIVLAAHLIEAVGATWSVSAIPVGRGFVQTAHGRLPVPAPATARLLEGFVVIDDGIEGERVTPTGAAIIRYLDPANRLPNGYALARTGYGFGKKVFPGLSNVVRVCRYETAEHDTPWIEDQVMKLSFELDDQTPESLAFAIDQLREQTGVLDVMQQAYWGKKNRQGFAISVLANVDCADAITQACFSLTTTLGIRRELINRAILPREQVVVYVGERSYRVKVAKRVEGYTAKIEMDDLTASGLTRKEQEEVRQQAEHLAIKQVEG